MTSGDDQVIKIYLHGLIERDCEAPVYHTAEEREAAERAAAAKRERYESGELRLVSLREAGSLQFIEADRACVRALQADGWRFDEETLKWANEGS